MLFFGKKEKEKKLTREEHKELAILAAREKLQPMGEWTFSLEGKTLEQHKATPGYIAFFTISLGYIDAQKKLVAIICPILQEYKIERMIDRYGREYLSEPKLMPNLPIIAASLSVYEKKEDGTRALVLSGENEFDIEDNIETENLENVVIRNGSRAGAITRQRLVEVLTHRHGDIYQFSSKEGSCSIPLTFLGEMLEDGYGYKAYKRYECKLPGMRRVAKPAACSVETRTYTIKIQLTYCNGENLENPCCMTVSLENLKIKSNHNAFVHFVG